MKFFLTTASAILLASQAIAAPMPHVKPDAVVVVEPDASHKQGPAPGNLVQQYQINPETPANTWTGKAVEFGKKIILPVGTVAALTTLGYFGNKDFRHAVDTGAGKVSGAAVDTTEYLRKKGSSMLQSASTIGEKAQNEWNKVEAKVNQSLTDLSNVTADDIENVKNANIKKISDNITELKEKAGKAAKDEKAAIEANIKQEQENYKKAKADLTAKVDETKQKAIEAAETGLKKLDDDLKGRKTDIQSKIDNLQTAAQPTGQNLPQPSDKVAAGAQQGLNQGEIKILEGIKTAIETAQDKVKARLNDFASSQAPTAPVAPASPTAAPAAAPAAPTGTSTA